MNHTDYQDNLQKVCHFLGSPSSIAKTLFVRNKMPLTLMLAIPSNRVQVIRVQAPNATEHEH